MAYKTIAAAEMLLQSNTKDLWTLADAVLADVPAEGRGGDRSKGPARGLWVGERLEEIATDLTERGVTKLDGDPYSASTLDHARDTAINWSPEQRLSEAAYRTHQEAGSAKSEGGKVLRALCHIARGLKVHRPAGVDVAAWEKAVEQVMRKRGLSRRYLVAANDLRLAMGHLPNVPGREAPPQTRQERIAITREVITDPDAVTELMSHKPTRRAAAEAISNARHQDAEHIRQVHPELPPKRDIDPADRPVGPRNGVGLLLILEKLGLHTDEARKLARAVLEGYEGIKELISDEDRDILLEEVQLAVNAWQMVHTGISGGGATDEALEEILRGGRQA